MAQSEEASLIARLRPAIAASRVPGILASYVFGSAAAGRLHRESDVDVAVLLDHRVYPTARDRFEGRVLLGAYLQTITAPRAADVVVLNDAPPTLGRRIVTEGCRLTCAEANADHAFRRDVQLRAADVEPFLRRTRRLKLEALAR